MRVQVQTIFPRSASKVWDLLLRQETFLYITHDFISYSDTEKWPAKLFTEGETLTTRVQLLGRGPSSHHYVRIIRVDEDQGKIETDESGGLFKTWNHQMKVQPISESECRYTDRIELEAGLLNPLVWMFARSFYRCRQRRWQQWLLFTDEKHEAANADS